MEVWKDVVGYEGIYEVSSIGRVRSSEGKITHSTLHGVRRWKSRLLKEKDPKGRDVRVSLYKDKIGRSFLVHQLVAMAFIPNPKNYKSINHLDGNPRNNAVDNLEWCDHYINNNHAFDNDLIGTNKRVVLREKETGTLKEFRSLSRASEYLGRSSTYLSRVIRKGMKVEGYDVYLRPEDFKEV